MLNLLHLNIFHIQRNILYVNKSSIVIDGLNKSLLRVHLSHCVHKKLHKYLYSNHYQPLRTTSFCLIKFFLSSALLKLWLGLNVYKNGPNIWNSSSWPSVSVFLFVFCTLCRFLRSSFSHQNLAVLCISLFLPVNYFAIRLVQFLCILYCILIVVSCCTVIAFVFQFPSSLLRS